MRSVYEELALQKDIGYTSVLKLLQIMTTKGTVRRNEKQRAHVYEACLPAEQTKRQIAGDMLQRVFEGSASQLMLHALAGRRTPREEIDELRRLLTNMKGTGDDKRVANWLSPNLMRPLGWALFHFLWQGTALAVVAAVAITLSAGLRLATWWQSAS